eukprot:Gb_35090 [translate_table: standard]
MLSRCKVDDLISSPMSVCELKRREVVKVKKKRSLVKMTLGEDIRVEQAVEYLGKALIGKFHSQIDLNDGLAKSMEIVVGDKTNIQILNYSKVPFCCVQCHLYGHVVKDCPHPFVKKVWRKKEEMGLKKNTKGKEIGVGGSFPFNSISHLKLVIVVEEESIEEKDGVKSVKNDISPPHSLSIQVIHGPTCEDISQSLEVGSTSFSGKCFDNSLTVLNQNIHSIPDLSDNAIWPSLSDSTEIVRGGHKYGPNTRQKTLKLEASIHSIRKENFVSVALSENKGGKGISGGLGLDPILELGSSIIGKKSFLRYTQDKALKEIQRGKQKSLKGLSIAILVEIHKPDVLLVQEMGEGHKIIRELRRLLKIGIWTKLHFKDLGHTFTVINYYGPYEDRQAYWDAFFYLPCVKDEKVIIGEPIKRKPTWRNNRGGKDGVAKRLDRFLVSEVIMVEAERIRSWIDSGGGYDHNPILLQIERQNDRPTSPFKFNLMWLEKEDLKILVQNEWIRFDPNSRESACFHLIASLKKVKEIVIVWVSIKRQEMDKDLKAIEKEVAVLFEGNELGIFSEERLKMKDLEHRKQIILAWREGEWRMKIRAIWIEKVNNQMLMEEVSKDELQIVLTSFKKDKSLGPDGWTIEFYSGFYDLLEEDLLRVIEEVKNSGKVSRSLNATFLDLIPKKDKHDVMLFINGNERESKKLKEILDIYGRATRMEINLQKSSIRFNGLEDKPNGYGKKDWGWLLERIEA